MSKVLRHKVPLIGSVAAGEPIIADAEFDVYVDSPEDADYALTVEGDSMEPLYLNGDMIYIKTQDDVDDGRVAVVLMDDTAALKHVYHAPNGLLLVSENPKYPPRNITFDDFDVIRILGIPVGYTRMYRRKD
jgi:repressor LexA